MEITDIRKEAWRKKKEKGREPIFHTVSDERLEISFNINLISILCSLQCDSANTDGSIKIVTWDVSQTLQLSVFVIKTNKNKEKKPTVFSPVVGKEEESCSET